VVIDMSDDLDMRRRRAAWRANHRGTKEMDVLLGRYAEDALPRLSGAPLEHFEQFLALPDPELQKWLLNPGEVPQSAFADLVAAVRTFHGLG
jgi:antitoxin CptB